MKVAIVIACLIAVAMCAKFVAKNKEQKDKLWKEWKDKYKPKYKDDKDDSKRREIWEKNLEKVDRHNAEKSSYTLAMNKFSDKTVEELNAVMLGLETGGNGTTSGHSVSASVPPAAVDWRTQGLVGNVKDQGSCGSCWAFNSLGALEGQYAKKYGLPLVPLSEQNLVACDGNNYGCNGGWMSRAYDFIKSNGGVQTEATYPYEGVSGTCQFNSALAAATCTGYVWITKGSETDLKDAVSNIGPIAVAIKVEGDFYSYSGGVYNNIYCSQRVNHGVLVVGYGTEGGMDYWLCKNSWGTGWGDQGYIKMRRNGDNQCAIADYAIYPLV